MECWYHYVLLCIFFFKQKTSYEMRISDWSSDVCSSDLQAVVDRHMAGGIEAAPDRAVDQRAARRHDMAERLPQGAGLVDQIGNRRLGPDDMGRRPFRRLDAERHLLLQMTLAQLVLPFRGLDDARLHQPQPDAGHQDRKSTRLNSSH